MRRTLLPALIPAAVIAILAACGIGTDASGDAPTTGSSQGIAFAKLDYDAALSRARTERKLVMVDLYTDWCGWCRKLDAEVFSDRAVGDATRGLVAVRVNAEKEGGDAVARRFEVEGFPTVLFLDGDGKLVKRIDGYVDKSEMLAVLRDLPRPRA